MTQNELQSESPNLSKPPAPADLPGDSTKEFGGDAEILAAHAVEDQINGCEADEGSHDFSDAIEKSPSTSEHDESVGGEIVQDPATDDSVQAQGNRRKAEQGNDDQPNIVAKLPSISEPGETIAGDIIASKQTDLVQGQEQSVGEEMGIVPALPKDEDQRVVDDSSAAESSRHLDQGTKVAEDHMDNAPDGAESGENGAEVDCGCNTNPEAGSKRYSVSDAMRTYRKIAMESNAIVNGSHDSQPKCSCSLKIG